MNLVIAAAPELHRRSAAPSRVGREQHPGHHALHILQFEIVGTGDAHAALNPGRAQMQMTHAVFFGKGGLGKGGFTGHIK
jgi:hypothetical protein